MSVSARFVICAVSVTAGCGLSAAPDEPSEEALVQLVTPCPVPAFITQNTVPVGFASQGGGTTGGGAATPQLVTTLAQFNAAAQGTNPAVIFVSGSLGAGSLAIGSNKTIIGCSGTNPTLRGAVAVKRATNVIVRNLNIVGFNCQPPDVNTASGGKCEDGQDAVTIERSQRVWFDHLAISDGTDGNLDITHGSDFITISNTKFFYSSARTDPQDTGAAGHRFSDLVGGSDSNGAEDAGKLSITWVHDWWAQNVVERQPRIRFGRNHLFNNLWSSSGNNYCVGVGVGANLLLQNNAFVNVRTPINTTSFVNPSVAPSAARSTGNVLQGTSGTAPTDLNPGSVFSPPYAFTLDSGSATQAFVQANAGPK